MLNLYTVGRLARIAEKNPAAVICEEMPFVKMNVDAVFWYEGRWVVYEGTENPNDTETYVFRYRECKDTEYEMKGEISASADILVLVPAAR